MTLYLSFVKRSVIRSVSSRMYSSLEEPVLVRKKLQTFYMHVEGIINRLHNNSTMLQIKFYNYFQNLFLLWPSSETVMITVNTKHTYMVVFHAYIKHCRHQITRYFPTLSCHKHPNYVFCFMFRLNPAPWPCRSYIILVFTKDILCRSYYCYDTWEQFKKKMLQKEWIFMEW